MANPHWRAADETVIVEPRILVIRRDNIGDLVCTTPLISALRTKFPRAWIGVLANSYNAPILEGNPDVNEVFAYRKAKHGEISRMGVIAERIRIATNLRRQHIDYILIATPTFQRRVIRFARWCGAKVIAGFAGERDPRGRLDIVVPIAQSEISEVEDVFRIGAPLGIEGPPPPLKVVPNPEEVARAMTAVAATRRESGVLIGVHVSARKPSQRWSEERYVAAMQALAERHQASFVLLWAPGAEDNPTHPGDDGKARRLLEAVRDLNVVAWPTETLRQLVGGIAACDFMLMSDGGAMHVAAALGKPMVCMFGKSDAMRWRPWGVAHELLQAPSQVVSDIAIEEVVAAFDRMMAAPMRARGEMEHF